jgi:hypothetical protein
VRIFFNFQSFRSEIDTNFDSLTQPIGIELTRFTRKKVEKLLPDENSVGGVAPIRSNLADFGAVFDLAARAALNTLNSQVTKNLNFKSPKPHFGLFASICIT